MAKFTAGLFIPYSLMKPLQSRRSRRLRQARTERLRRVREAVPEDGREFSYESAIGFLVQQGLDEVQVRKGSMPEEALRFCTELLAQRLSPETPALGLHVGNFVGVSLAYLAHFLKGMHPESVLFAVDPNIPHRGVENPQRYVSALLTYFSLQKNVCMITGYSLSKNVSNDGYLYGTAYDPFDHFEEESAPEYQLRHLRSVAGGRFDFCLIDGNHEASYLQEEMTMIADLLKPEGLMFLDDITPGWEDIQRTYREADRKKFAPLSENGRVGVLQVCGEAHG